MGTETGGGRPHTGAHGPPRFGGGPITTALNLGSLALLVGTWQGTGFNVMWRPDNNQPPENSAIRRFLELNLTSETLDFHVIPGVVPNRGVADQPDLNLYGLHYLQRISDADPSPFSTAGQALHIEPGLFMNVPGSSPADTLPPASDPPPVPALPDIPDRIVRMASIPHGVSVLMQGPNPGTAPTPGPPNIPPLIPFAGLPANPGRGIQPINLPAPAPGAPLGPVNGPSGVHVVPEVNLASDGAGSQSNGPYPPSFQALVDDPNSMLNAANTGKDILGTVTIDLSTDDLGSGIENIPFLGVANPAAPGLPFDPNAFVYSVNATFWIEWVRIPHEHRPHYPRREHGNRHDGEHNPLYEIEPFLSEPTYLQLQYSQLVILIFNGVLWPHITVATLTLSAG